MNLLPTPCARLDFRSEQANQEFHISVTKTNYLQLLFLQISHTDSHTEIGIFRWQGGVDKFEIFVKNLCIDKQVKFCKMNL